MSELGGRSLRPGDGRVAQAWSQQLLHPHPSPQGLTAGMWGCHACLDRAQPGQNGGRRHQRARLLAEGGRLEHEARCPARAHLLQVRSWPPERRGPCPWGATQHTGHAVRAHAVVPAPGPLTLRLGG